VNKEGDKANRFWIAVDGGLDVLDALKVRPDLMIGDWDSLKNRKLLDSYSAVQRVDLSTKKDRSDFSYALNVLPKNVKHVFGFGFLGGRLDHALAVFYEVELWLAKRKNTVLELVSESERVLFLAPSSSDRRISVMRDSVFSVFSVSPKATGVYLQGAKYSLYNAELRPSSLGLSNVVHSEKNQIRIRHRQGILALVFSYPYAKNKPCQPIQSMIDTDRF
jgi:thiamine pyrophosphokinase